MSLYKSIKNLFFAASVATAINCGDINKYYNVVGKEENAEALNIQDCNDVAARLYECNYKNVQTEGKWDTIVTECSPERVDFFKNAPLWIKCISENDCVYINAGSCDKYMVDY